MSGHDGNESPPTERWTAALNELVEAGVFDDPKSQATNERNVRLWTRLRDAGALGVSSDAVATAALLSQIESFTLQPDVWSTPYQAWLTLPEGRTTTPSDLDSDQLELLAEIAPMLPDARLRAVGCDVMALSVGYPQRLEWFAKTIEAVRAVNPDELYNFEARSVIDRAVIIAKRHSKNFSSQLETLIDGLAQHAIQADETRSPGAAADLLHHHGLARGHAMAIAERMRKLADTGQAPSTEGTRNYLARSVDWFVRADDHDRASEAMLAIVNSLIADAAESSGARSAYLYERALKELRRIPRADRERLGVVELADELTTRIRAAGAAALGDMSAMRAGSFDLTDLRKNSEGAVQGKDSLEALRALIELFPLASYERDFEDARESVAKHPLSSLFSTVHYSRDGRVVHRSGDDRTPIYGTDSNIWRTMIQSFEWRIGAEVQGAIAPAWLVVSNEHLLSANDFYQIARGSAVVPADREKLVAVGLYYGFIGDFATAVHVLTPQIENIVRYHMQNAGLVTTAIDDRGVHNEIGLSGLMTRESTVDLFGQDLAYNIRALFCGPLGPNLRNVVAHGLESDSWAGSAEALYCWWFTLRLVFIPYWNRIHDSAAADAQEPREPGDG